MLQEPLQKKDSDREGRGGADRGKDSGEPPSIYPCETGGDRLSLTSLHWKETKMMFPL